MGKIRKKWSDEELEEAMKLVKMGRSISGTSKITNIPKTTLRNKCNGVTAVGATVGPATILNSEEEAHLVKWILHLSEKGFPVTRRQLTDSVALLVKKLKKTSPFNDGKPGRSWIKGFCKRHPSVADKISRQPLLKRQDITYNKLSSWFESTEKFLDENNLKDIGPERQFNGEEVVLFLCPKTGKVLDRKIDKDIYPFGTNDVNECVSVTLVGNAAGQLAPPLVTFKYGRLPRLLIQTMPSDWAIGKSDEGWMNGACFLEFMTNVFEPWLTKSNIQRPVIFYLEGHRSHLTVAAAEFCQQQQIILIPLFNASKIIQPIDVSLLPPLETVWLEDVANFRKTEKRRMRRDEFAPLLKASMEKLDTESLLRNGFQATGLHPFNVGALRENHLLNKIVENSPDQEEPTTSNCQSNGISGLQLLEDTIESIEPGLVDAFEQALEGEWAGELQHLSLFNVWKNIRNT